MLYLTRRAGESLAIKTSDGEITVTVMDGYRVTLGIEAPKGVAIARDDMKRGPQKERATGRTGSAS